MRMPRVCATSQYVECPCEGGGEYFDLLKSLLKYAEDNLAKNLDLAFIAN